MDLHSILCDWDEQVIQEKSHGKSYLKKSHLENDELKSSRDKKLSRIERHKSELANFECDWEKFPEVKRGWGRRKKFKDQCPNDFQLFAVKMAIVDHKYPEVLIEQEVVWPLHDFIFSTLIAASKPYAKIGVSNVIDGALRVNCFGTKAVDWLKGLEGIAVEGITLKILEANELSKFSTKIGLGCSSDVSYNEPKATQGQQSKSKNIHNSLLTKNSHYFKKRLYKMAIVSDRHADVPILESVVPSIQATINRLLNTSNVDKPLIRITQVLNGAIHVDCEGKSSLDCLTKLEGMSVEDIKLKVLKAENLVEPIKMIWTTKKHLTDTAKMLGYLQRWNKELKTGNWRIVYTYISGFYLRRLVLMDLVSANIIKKANYKLFAGVEFTQFILCENKGSMSEFEVDKHDCTSRLSFETPGAGRVGICNVESMTETQMNLVYATLIKTMQHQAATAARGSGPQFGDLSFKHGWILVTFANQRSKEWLAKEVLSCRPWPEAQLSLVQESELPELKHATTRDPKLEISSTSVAIGSIKIE